MEQVPSAEQLLSGLRRRLSPPARRLLALCRESASARGEALYLVGGALRDLLRAGGAADEAPELDLALEGDAAALARAVAAASGATLLLHDSFMTARITLGEATIDIAATRSERYPQPAALPVVRPAPIEHDLTRRDFSVNALALRLTGEQPAEIIDPCGGLRDLKAGRIRILHDASFQDDPTRMLRACRYGARLQAGLSRTTAQALRRDAATVRRLSSERLGTEWRRLLEDRAAPGALKRAAALGLPAAAIRGWRPPPRLRRAFSGLGARRRPEQFWALSGLIEGESAVAAAFTHRCALRREEQEALADGQRLRRLQQWLGRPGLRPSAAASALRPMAEPALVAAAALWRGRAAQSVERFRGEWRPVESPLAAEALLELGVPHGPEIGAWLTALRDARLDGALAPGRAGTAAAKRWVESSPTGDRARRPGIATRPPLRRATRKGSRTR